MPRITETFTVDLPIEEAFAFLSDFTNLETWDPSVRDAEQVAGDGPGIGARVRLGFAAGPATVPLTYETTRFDEPTRVTFATSNAVVQGEDDITLASSGDATTVRWDARFGFSGPLRLADPLMAPGFQRVAENAVASLRDKLRELAEAHARRQASA